jgi:hypothetical protein
MEGTDRKGSKKLDKDVRGIEDIVYSKHAGRIAKVNHK